LTEVFWVSFLLATIRMATPLLLASLGEIVSERSGVFNIGLEGMMLMGAFCGFLGLHFTGSLWAGLIAGMAGGVFLALISAYLSVVLGVDQIVSGIALNIFAVGFTSSFFRIIFGLNQPQVEASRMIPLSIPVLKKIPFLGPVLFNQIPLIYVTFALVPILWFVLFRTTVGLQVRSAGEHPLAAEIAGINIVNLRHMSVLLAGLMAGLGGAYLSLGPLNLFSDNMIAGRGFIALAVVIFGRLNPFGALGASLLFGAAEALQLKLQAMGLDVPYQILLMLPYVATVVALLGLIGKTRLPTALGVPYMASNR
ncbi:MAG: ABC transporter permease, partial [bacterium]